jgi:cysteine desulfurase
MSAVVRESLLAAFDQGWADPKKLSQTSAKAAILRNQSLENIAHRLGVKPHELYILGEPALGHFLAVAGLLTENSEFIYSATDKGKIRAIARSHSGKVTEASVDKNGQMVLPNEPLSDSVLSLQSANGETGIIQKNDASFSKVGFVSIDATTSGPRLPLPSHWDTALFDSQSWGGPSGLAILAVRNSSRYSYPLPRIAPISVPGTYSLPLLIAASIALENFQLEDSKNRTSLIAALKVIPDVSVVGESAEALPHILSCIVGGVDSEQLVRQLSQRGFDLDTGSACSPEDLQPSHVLAAMGLATAGHLRITLHRDATENSIEDLVTNIEEVVTDLRR